MKTSGQKIKFYRHQKKWTQQELADKTNLNLRTIQRLENNETKPRFYTLNSIAKALEVSDEEIQENLETKSYKSLWFHNAYLIITNFVILSVFGFLTLDSNANFNAFVGSIMLSIFIPIGLYYFTPKLQSIERFTKLSVGLWLYLLALIILHGFDQPFKTGLIYVVTIYSFVLYYLPNLKQALKKF